jgi:hypothetical protein
MKIDHEFDCTQREIVIDIASIVYRSHGGELPLDDPLYLWRSQHPTEQNVLYTAEQIFELFHGDEPDYSDDPDDIEAQALAIEEGKL